MTPDDGNFIQYWHILSPCPDLSTDRLIHRYETPINRGPFRRENSCPGVTPSEAI